MVQEVMDNLLLLNLLRLHVVVQHDPYIVCLSLPEVLFVETLNHIFSLFHLILHVFQHLLMNVSV
ncbi:unnamed protein product [Schistosoma mattheei]|uniref:Uncharacterized protein n=1 Tax=Schistosoma mattheei TaxID=31246 RepID=A0A3P8EN50_9TREM|nr:unnamed protein product [Schistosoma mattheei]